MRTVARTVTQVVDVPVYEPGDKFRRGTSRAKYVLATFHVGDKTYGALLNADTGETVHKLKPIASYDEVTEAELELMNFNNPPACRIND